MFYVPSAVTTRNPSNRSKNRAFFPSFTSHHTSTSASSTGNQHSNEISPRFFPTTPPDPVSRSHSNKSNKHDKSSAVSAKRVIQKLVHFDESQKMVTSTDQNHCRFAQQPHIHSNHKDQTKTQRSVSENPPRNLMCSEVLQPGYSPLTNSLQRSISMFSRCQRKEMYNCTQNSRQCNTVDSIKANFDMPRSFSANNRETSVSSILFDYEDDLWQQKDQTSFMILPISPSDSYHAAADYDSISTTLPFVERVTLNVSGMKFETWSSVLENHPTTLLGNPGKRAIYYDKIRHEYFFDRHRPTFEAIFHYYLYGGRLKRPVYIPDEIFLSELEYYELERDAINDYKRDEGYIIDNVEMPDSEWKRVVWMLFEFPETSAPAFLIAIISVVFTIISIILLCVETIETFKVSHCAADDVPNFGDPFFVLETMCTLWFTIEVIVRFFACPSKREYCKDLKNAIDVTAIVPYYVTLVNVLISFSCKNAKNSASLAFLRVIRLIRVFKLTKHSPGLQVLVHTFRASLEGLGLFLVALVVCMLVFSSTLYYVEVDVEGSQIESIPDAFWWAIITMCTVGYGDRVPKGDLGKLVGSMCAIAGVLTLAIPVPIITENFNKFYMHKTGRGRN